MFSDRIMIDPEICHGKPTIRGLRYPVEMMLELLSAGMATEEILADYEDLEREDILAALEFATRLTQIASPFTPGDRQCLELALRQYQIAQLERQHAEGYARHPVGPGEFDVWEAEQVWEGHEPPGG